MFTVHRTSLVAALIFAAITIPVIAIGRKPGPWVKLYNGKDLTGWHTEGSGAKISAWQPEGDTLSCKGKSIGYLSTDKEYGDFELKLEYRLTGANTGNSGIQYRSEELPDVAKWVLKGYQADIDANQTYTGQIYEERGRGFLALRGMFSYIRDGKKVGAVSSLGDGAELKNFIKIEDWNEMHIIARGNVIVQMMNGHVMSMLIDDDKAGRKMSGLIGIQLHRTPGPLKIEAKNIRLKEM